MPDPAQPKKPAEFPTNALKPFGVQPGFVVHGSKPELADPDPDPFGLGATVSAEFSDFVKDLMQHVHIHEAMGPRRWMSEPVEPGLGLEDFRKSQRSAAERRVRGTLDSLGQDIERAGIPSSQWDVPIDTLMAQYRDSMPEVASALSMVRVGGRIAMNEYAVYTAINESPHDNPALPLERDQPMTIGQLQGFMSMVNAQLPPAE